MLEPPSQLRIAAQIHWQVGHALGSWGWGWGARRAFRDAVRANPRLIDAQLSLADSFARSRLWNEAALAYREAARLQPSSVDAQGNLGLALMRAGRPVRAVGAIDGLIRARAGDPLPHLLRGALLLELGRRAEAIHSFRWAAQLPASEEDGRFTLGPALVGPAAWQRVVEQHRQARDLKSGPDPAESRQDRSRLNTHPGDLPGRNARPRPEQPSWLSFLRSPLLGLTHLRIHIANALAPSRIPPDRVTASRKHRTSTADPAAFELGRLGDRQPRSDEAPTPPAPVPERRKEIRSLNLHRVWRARRAAARQARPEPASRVTARRQTG